MYGKQMIRLSGQGSADREALHSRAGLSPYALSLLLAACSGNGSDGQGLDLAPADSAAIRFAEGQETFEATQTDRFSHRFTVTT